MCCSDSGCGFTEFYVNVHLIEQRVESLRIPRIEDVFPTIVLKESDTPTVTIVDGPLYGEEFVLDMAEADVIKDILNREDLSPDVSDALQKIRDANNTLVIQNSEERLMNAGAAEIEFEEVPQGSGNLKQDQQIVLRINREQLMKNAEAWNRPYEEVLAETILHELGHPGLGTVESSHGLYGNNPDPTHYSFEPIGRATRRAYKALYPNGPGCPQDGCEPPGYLHSGLFLLPHYLVFAMTLPIVNSFKGLPKRIMHTLLSPAFQ